MFKLNINGAIHVVDAPANMPLLWVLRDLLQLTGTKYGCGIGQCGACTIHLDGAAVRSCSFPLESAAGREIITIEGLANGDVLHPVQKAWIAQDVPQCGYCQSGQMMQAAALIAENSDPSDHEINQAMKGNICRCGTYLRIQKAIKQAAKELASYRVLDDGL